MYDIVKGVTTLLLLLLLVFIAIYAVFATQRVAKLNCENVYQGKYHYFAGCEYNLPALEKRLVRT